MTDSSTYTPAVGDSVMMPQAPEPWPAQRVYTVDKLTASGSIRLKNGTDTWTLPIEWPRDWGITRVYTREQAVTAIVGGSDMVEGLSENGGDAASDMTSNALTRIPQQDPWFTYADISSALNDAANNASEVVDYENSDTIRNDSARDLAVNAALYLLDHPDADLYDIITTQYTDIDVDKDELPEGTVKGDAAWNDAIYETVKGWVW